MNRLSVFKFSTFLIILFFIPASYAVKAKVKTSPIGMSGSMFTALAGADARQSKAFINLGQKSSNKSILDMLKKIGQIHGHK